MEEELHGRIEDDVEQALEASFRKFWQDCQARSTVEGVVLERGLGDIPPAELARLCFQAGFWMGGDYALELLRSKGRLR